VHPRSALGEPGNPVGHPRSVGQDGEVEPVELRADELVLRPWRAADVGALHAAFDDSTIRQWSTGLPEPYLPSHADTFVTATAPRQLAEDAAVFLGVFAADATGDGGMNAPAGPLGGVALTELDLAEGTADLDYWTAVPARGRRVAERASRALLRWAFDDLKLARVDWQAFVGNQASRLTGLRLGVEIIGVRPGTDDPRRDNWVGSLLPGGLTAAGHDLPDRVRRRAHVFGAAQPTLDAGAGVRLRRPAAEDVAGITDACRDPEAVRWTTVPDPYAEADSQWYVHQHAPSVWALGTGAVFVVTAPDGSYAGTIDLRVSPADPAVADVGFLIAPHARGRGHATRALRALALWGFDALGLERVEWKAHVGNTASRRVAEKAGFTVEGIVRSGIAHRGGRRDCWTAALLPVTCDRATCTMRGPRIGG
jgi:RimJ/RimL family protein N-acetyltransferase